MRRTKEGGSVLGFVVVAVVLAGLLAGGAYFISRQSSPLPASTTNKPPEQPKEKKEGPPAAEPGNKPEKRVETPESTPQTGMTHELPTTGPRETLGSILVVGLVTGVSVSYLRSRRANLSL